MQGDRLKELKQLLLLVRDANRLCVKRINLRGGSGPRDDTDFFTHFVQLLSDPDNVVL